MRDALRPRDALRSLGCGLALGAVAGTALFWALGLWP
jgi:hypothetical protein